ncbi:hypothetical protein QWJ90_11805 [Microbacterium oryzae]|uniref:hypothetical protein n=1 Tax=Microbacterium oryzae TaxID=743009 RepID=UPI0025AFAA1A|nr:hypothetical protein [Microbacterium oryzae]MDN3311616.1 hypothetical protein [Microbacterium oryzae]
MAGLALVVAVLVVAALVVGSGRCGASEITRQTQYDNARAETAAAIDELSKARDETEALITSRIEDGKQLSAALDASEGYLEERARTGALAAVDGYVKGLGAVELPEPLESLPEESHVEDPERFAAALGALERVETEAVSGSEEVSAAGGQVESLDADLTVAFSVFRESLPPRAEAVAGENPDALEEFRTAVRDAAAAVAAAEDLSTLPDSLEGFRGAVDALRADQQRAAEAIEAERLEAERLEAERLEALERERQQQVVPPPAPQPVPEPVPEPEPTPDPEVTPDPVPSPDDAPEETPAPEVTTPAEPESTPAP